jgi:hypothetical protein
MFVGYDILSAVTRLQANTNIIYDWHVNPTQSDFTLQQHLDALSSGAAQPYHGHYNHELRHYR